MDGGGMEITIIYGSMDGWNTMMTGCLIDGLIDRVVTTIIDAWYS
jgi:hypothetical protein